VRADNSTTKKQTAKTSKEMKIINHQRKSRQGFTLIEMIGVLAVIAILASMLIPKIFEAINSSRINNAAVGYNTMKTAAMDHYGKYGSITSSNGVLFTTTQLANYDKLVLLPEGLIDKPFSVRIGDGSANTLVRVVPMAATAAVDGTNPQYDLDGDNTSDTGGSGNLVEAIISNVATADAIELSQRLDGTALSNAANATTSDFKGRIKYAAPVGGLTDVHIYIAHR
jgi:prepilin-type N-terminal cleavage/methylation domain-containing protein